MSMTRTRPLPSLRIVADDTPEPKNRTIRHGVVAMMDARMRRLIRMDMGDRANAICFPVPA